MLCGGDAGLVLDGVLDDEDGDGAAALEVEHVEERREVWEREDGEDVVVVGDRDLEQLLHLAANGRAVLDPVRRRHSESAQSGPAGFVNIKLRVAFGIRKVYYYDGISVLMSTKGSAQPDGPPYMTAAFKCIEIHVKIIKNDVNHVIFFTCPS